MMASAQAPHRMEMSSLFSLPSSADKCLCKSSNSALLKLGRPRPHQTREGSFLRL